MTDLLRVRDLSVEFHVDEGVIRAVKGTSFRVPQGRTVALVGESGAGKSVVSQAIMGILPKSARIAGGEILFSDPDRPGKRVDIAKLGPDDTAMRQIRGGRISIIFQEPTASLSPLHTIGNQIQEALRLHSEIGKRAGHETTLEMLRHVGFPEPAKAFNCYPFELSGGLRQRAMIAMALVCRPALLIADEPTTALDVTIQAQILKLMKDLQSEFGMALLLITHDLGVVANMADEVVVMYYGEVMEAGTLSDIFRRGRHPYLKALLAAVPRFNMRSGERLVPIREIKPHGGQLMRQKEPWPEDADAAGPLLQVSHLSKRFVTRKHDLWGGGPAAEVVAVEDVSFDIRRGECLGLVGESGSGKTTVSKVILRALSADGGEVKFNQRGKIIDVLKLKNEELLAYRRKAQFIFQDPYHSLNPRMTVFDIISEPLLVHGMADRDERSERVKELMTLVGLDIRYLRRYPHSFSGGQRQRIGVARALALRPDLLICDEPVSALDVSIQAQVLNLLKDLRAELGLTYLFISHNMAVIDYIADRVAVMCAGHLVELAPRDGLFANPHHPYTKALLAAVPDPDPESRLDLSALMAGRASQPAAWPAPFTIDGSAKLKLIEVDRGHYVRAAQDGRPPETGS